MHGEVADRVVGVGRRELLEPLLDELRAQALINAPPATLTTAENVTTALYSLIGSLPTRYLEGRRVLVAAGVPHGAIRFRYALDARYLGQGNEITIAGPEADRRAPRCSVGLLRRQRLATVTRRFGQRTSSMPGHPAIEGFPFSGGG